jgi:hypothetical protein
MPHFYGKSINDSLHILKDTWKQKAYIGEHSRTLAEGLETAINATNESAPIRTIGYFIHRDDNNQMDPSQRERIWEQSIFRKWNSQNQSEIPGCWKYIIAFQVPLFNDKNKDFWGKIDLLGISQDGTLSVIELKKDPKTLPTGRTGPSETPLRIIMEAAAYAIAIKKNWEIGFRNELIQQLRFLNVFEKIDTIPEKITKIRLVGAAPASYWLDWMPTTEKGKTVTSETWGDFSTLITELGEKGFPVSFVSINGDHNDSNTISAEPITFPLI